MNKDLHKQYLEDQLNALRGELTEMKSEIRTSLEDEVIESKKYIKEYLVDKLDKFLSWKSNQWKKEEEAAKKKTALVDLCGTWHPKYWSFVCLGGRMILSVIVLPLFFLGWVVALTRKLRKK